MSTIGRESDSARWRGLTGSLVHWSVAFPAAGITFVLCLFMGRLIQVEFVEPPEKERIVLAVITPSKVINEPFRTPRILPDRMEDALPPPPPPKLGTEKTDIDLPAPIIQGEAPKEVELGRMGDFVGRPIVIDERDARPISPPVAQYPDRMAQRGIEGRCDVHFNVNVRGEPIDIEATCSDAGFARAAEQAVSKVRFAPKIVRGQTVERENVVYPIEFRLDG